MKSVRILSVLLIMSLLLSLLPATAGAADRADAGGNLVTTKNTELADDGSYTIQMEAYSEGFVEAITLRKPTDITIVMDVSGSMTDPDWATSGTASWQKYKGWYTTAERLVEEGQTFYCNAHSDAYYEARLVKIENFSYNGSASDLYGYYCQKCGYSSSIYYSYGKPVSKYVTAVLGNGDCPIESLDLYRKTSDITRIEAMKQAVNAFIATTAAENVGVEEDEQHRITLIKYAGYRFNGREVGNDYYFTVSSSDGNKYYASDEFGKTATVNGKTYTYSTNCSQILYESAYVNSSTQTAMQNAVNGLNAGGSTYAHEGVYLASEAVEKNLETHPDREQIVLFFTDGEPTTKIVFEDGVANSAISYAKVLKEAYGAKIYSINMLPESAITEAMTSYMNYVSSNYPNAQSLTSGGTKADSKYYKQVHDMADLNELFADISTSISGTDVTLDGESQLRDYLSDEFMLGDGVRVVVQTVDYKGDGNWSDVAETVQEFPPKDEYAASQIHILVDREAGLVSVDGFSYKDNYIYEAHGQEPAGGKKLVVTIYGVRAKDGAVQNGFVSTNTGDSGVYPDDDPSSPNLEPFPVPEVKLTSKTYVWDYGRPAFLSSSDWDQKSVNHLGKSMESFGSNPTTTLALDYGVAKLEATATDGFSYYPKTMKWDGYDSFYVHGKEDSGVNTWAKINIIPANNVYYEDDFIAGNLNAEDGIVYTNGSKPEGMSEEDWAAMQSGWRTTAESGGAQEDPNGDVHGWISDLSEAAGHSDGAAHIVEAVSGQSNSQLPSASFTFTGTGMDIYSFTDSTTGTIMVSVAKQGGSTKYYVVDNYAASGKYYQIPNVTFTGDYGTYDVTIYVTSAAQNQGRFTFYLDGIRVYNPLGATEDELVSEAYTGEWNALFTEVRNILSGGAVFIDKDANGNISVEMEYDNSDYARYAPEHEVYLDTNQSVTFAVEDGTANYYIGLKALAGGATTAYVSNGDSLADITVEHTTDLYYKVTPYYDSTTGMYVVTVSNAGSKLLAITKLRQTSPGTSTLSLRSLNRDEAIRYTAIFDGMEVKPYVASSPMEDVEIQKPAVSETDVMTAIYNRLRQLAQQLFAGLDGWF